jgi:hypothetical protein
MAGGREWTVPVTVSKPPEDWHNRDFKGVVTQILQHLGGPFRIAHIQADDAGNGEHIVTITVDGGRASFGPLPIWINVARMYRRVELQHWCPDSDDADKRR